VRVEARGGARFDVDAPASSDEAELEPPNAPVKRAMRR
jgi:hypothetical protein